MSPYYRKNTKKKRSQPNQNMTGKGCGQMTCGGGHNDLNIIARIEQVTREKGECIVYKPEVL